MSSEAETECHLNEGPSTPIRALVYVHLKKTLQESLSLLADVLCHRH